MRAHDLTPAEWSRRASLSNANALYNFLNGLSKSLSQQMLENLARCIPGATVAQILGETPPISDRHSSIIVIRGAVEAGRFKQTWEWPIEDQYRTTIPIPYGANAGVYGAKVVGHGADELYPDGTILACVPLVQSGRELADGNKVILHRYRAGLVEASVRIVRIDPDGNWWLAPASSNPAITTVEMPRGTKGDSFTFRSNRYEVVAIIVGAFRYES